jgi:L-asparaginase II
MSEQETQGAIQIPAPLVEVWRGPIIESRHRGHIIAVDGNGRTLAHLGTPDTVTYLRSSAKPFQAIPLLTSGAADRFGFTEKEIALACASHSGEPIHTETVTAMLRKIGLDASALKCGTHEPFGQSVALSLRAKGEQPNVLQNNCSGKHAGMLALALHLGAPTESYDHANNPAQIAISRTIEQFSSVPLREIVVGTDGCGVPVFGLSVRAMALMYARLVAPPENWDGSIRGACGRIVSAMISWPEMVGGTVDRLDTEMIRAAKDLLISKVGAEGVYTVGVLPSPKWPEGLGLAIKIEDGEDRRARPTVVIESLRQLGVLTAGSLKAVAPYARFPVRNNRGETVGEVRPSFELVRA